MALEKEINLPFEVYDQVVAEPTEQSWRDAIAWARKHDFSHFLAYYSIPRSVVHHCLTSLYPELVGEA
jgi:hypothetical protein